MGERARGTTVSQKTEWGPGTRWQLEARGTRWHQGAEGRRSKLPEEASGRKLGWAGAWALGGRGRHVDHKVMVSWGVAEVRVGSREVGEEPKRVSQGGLL